MAEFFQLSTAERLEALDLAANTLGFLPHRLEKDIWVVWSLRHLFAAPNSAAVFAATCRAKPYRHTFDCARCSWLIPPQKPGTSLYFSI